MRTAQACEGISSTHQKHKRIEKGSMTKPNTIHHAPYGNILQSDSAVLPSDEPHNVRHGLQVSPDSARVASDHVFAGHLVGVRAAPDAA